MKYLRTITIEHVVNAKDEFNALLASDNRLNAVMDRLDVDRGETMQIKKSKIVKLPF